MRCLHLHSHDLDAAYSLKRRSNKPAARLILALRPILALCLGVVFLRRYAEMVCPGVAPAYDHGGRARSWPGWPRDELDQRGGRTRPLLRGTEGSNPACSSRESCELAISRRIADRSFGPSAAPFEKANTEFVSIMLCIRAVRRV